MLLGSNAAITKPIIFHHQILFKLLSLYFNATTYILNPSPTLGDQEYVV
jgi:hypothetical protein